MALNYSDPPEIPWSLLTRHLAAEATASERAALRAWVQADPTHLQILTTVTRAWERAGDVAARPVVISPQEVKAAWERFKPAMVAAPTAPASAPVATPPVARPLWPTGLTSSAWLRVAACVALLVAGYRLWPGALRQPPIPTDISYASGAQRRPLTLPDGSRVWLHAHSRLRYTGLGGGAAGRRTVQLSGEAYFEVQHQPDRPFLVSTATARVRVTGTAFNVRAYAAEDSVEVCVTRGRVWLAGLAFPDSVLLTAATRAALQAADAPGRMRQPLRSRATADQNFRAWQTDTLRFRDATVQQVARTLRAAFGTSVRVTSPGLNQCRFTGTFPQPQPAQVLAVLAVATASRLTPDARGGYVLRGAGCAMSPRPAALPPAVPLQP